MVDFSVSHLEYVVETGKLPTMNYPLAHSPTDNSGPCHSLWIPGIMYMQIGPIIK